MKIITVSIDCARCMLLALNFTPCPPLNSYVVCMYLFIVEFTQTSIRLGMYIEIGVVAAV